MSWTHWVVKLARKLLVSKRGATLLALILLPVLLRRRRRAGKRDTLPAPALVPFSAFLQAVRSGDVDSVMLSAQALLFSRKSSELHGGTFLTRPVSVHPAIVDLLVEHGVSFEQLAPSQWPGWGRVAVAMVPFVYLAVCAAVFWKFYNQSMGGDVGNSSVRQRGSHGKRTSFADVAGIDDAKGVVQEISDMLKHPAKYESVGARVPTGVLLIGPPGTGKTLLARAIADDAGLPFFYCSGSDFVEVFAGRGASRVRGLFAKASKAAPSVLFFDEIDALGKVRGGTLTMNEEREQTLNQLLAAMDGFDSDKRVVVMAATNRFDVLDGALVRPGRFDRVVKLTLPSAEGRRRPVVAQAPARILEVHTRGKSLAPDADLRHVAAVTSGFSGAELAMLANEAAIAAARHKRKELELADFMTAADTFKTSRGRGESGSSPLNVAYTFGSLD